MSVITRFAPSPTGYLHIGSARTALFNYLFAKHHQGQFLLRIEDTDKERSTEEATAAIFSGLKWLGLDWDGEVVFQSHRAELHKKAALSLLEQGRAYYCFTSQEEVNQERQDAIANKGHFIFKSKWRDASPEEYPRGVKPVIRLKAPREGQTIIHDKLQGDVVVENSHLDDMVLLRSDGTPTYMLAVVVDDHDMGITHIIRGDDHLTNAARQILLYQAFGWDIPVMVHIPLIHGTDGAKLSKRHGALGTDAYKDMGYLPEALCNYLLRLGWSHKNDEIISKEQAIEWFDLDGLGASPARLDFAKMQYLNAHYLRGMPNDKLTGIVVRVLESKHRISNEVRGFIFKGMDGLKLRAELLNELVEMAKIYLVDEDVKYSDEGLEVVNNCNKENIAKAIYGLENLEIMNKETVQELFKTLALKNGLKLGEFIQPLRVLLTGYTASPSIFEIISIIGKDHAIKRLTNHLNTVY